MSRPATLLVIGIHREELAFGQAVAASLDPASVQVLAIPDGLSGRHPRSDQGFHWDTLHRVFYLQLRPHVRGQQGFDGGQAGCVGGRCAGVRVHRVASIRGRVSRPWA